MKKNTRFKGIDIFFACAKRKYVMTSCQYENQCEINEQNTTRI